MEQVRKNIPKECFEKDLGKSVFYMVRDWAIIAALYYFQSYFFAFGFLGKFVWWNLVGFFGWALFGNFTFHFNNKIKKYTPL